MTSSSSKNAWVPFDLPSDAWLVDDAFDRSDSTFVLRTGAVVIAPLVDFSTNLSSSRDKWLVSLLRKSVVVVYSLLRPMLRIFDLKSSTFCSSLATISRPLWPGF